MAKRIREITAEDQRRNTPVYVVWETTLQCNHACAHCGSRASPQATRPKELTTGELFQVADKLAAMGTREVTLIGGEAYLRDDICELVAHLKGHGMRVTMQTGGRGLSQKLCERLVEAGMSAIGVSLDGPATVHDQLRASPGSHLWGLRALKNAREAGLITTSNIQINRLNKDHLRETRDIVRDAGVRIWRAQLTVPMGRAADVRLLWSQLFPSVSPAPPRGRQPQRRSPSRQRRGPTTRAVRKYSIRPRPALLL